MNTLNSQFFIGLILLVIVGFIGMTIFPSVHINVKNGIVYIIIGVLLTNVLPVLYRLDYEYKYISSTPSYQEYKAFTDVNYDMELTGLYQHIFKDSYLHILDRTRNKKIKVTIEDR